MPHFAHHGKRSSSSENSSNCRPLKKRPIRYDSEDSDSDVSYKVGIPSPQSLGDVSEPENLSTKPQDLRVKQDSPTPAYQPSPPALSPPPISLVAGRGGAVVTAPTSPLHGFSGSPVTSPQHHPSFHYQNHAQYSQYSPPGYSIPLAHPSKPLSGGGPLEPISLNPPAAWSKHIHPNYPSPALPTTSAGQRSPYMDYVSSTPSSSHFNHSCAPAPLYLGKSHFAPYAGRDSSGSPPHVSPPLAVEPAYPVIKIEEAHRGSRQPFSHQHLNSQTKFYEEITTPVAHHSRSPQHQTSSLKPKEHCYPSPPHLYQSTESRDSVISHGSVSSSTSNSQNQQPVAPPPQIPHIAPITVNGSTRYQCPHCNKSYSTYSGLTKHIQFHCAHQNKKKFICKFCEKVYFSLGALKMHIRTHTLPCKCDLCGKAFSRPWLLQGHVRTHTGEKPFSCQHCNRAFADRSNLRAHLQTHSEVKKYSCKHCSKTFSRMSLLVKHEDGGCNGGASSPQNHSLVQ